EEDPLVPLKARKTPMKLMAASLHFTTFFISTIFTFLHVIIITTNLVKDLGAFCKTVSEECYATETCRLGGATKQLGLIRGVSIINQLQAGKRRLEHLCKQVRIQLQVGGKKSTLRGLLVDTPSHNCNLPRTKTPNVVARLMGLDLLPDNLELTRSPRNGVRGHRLSGNGSGTRSLPASPRISSDSENHRLSLELNRENNKHEEFVRTRLKELKQDEQSPSPRYSGRQIVKQTKKRVTTRKFGMDVTNLLEKKRAGGAAQNRISQKEKTTSTNPAFVLRQYQQPATVITLSKENQQSLRPISGWEKAESKSKFSPHPTPNNRNKQRKEKQCKKIYVTSSAFSATERPRKQVKRAQEPERKADATICSGQKMYKYEKKLPQEPSSSKFYDSNTISPTIINAGETEKDVPGMNKLEEEEERVVSEIERQIVDALVQETVETTSLWGLNANAVSFVRQ
ncbi:hypothetical protein, partial [Arabidopsis thaliana]